MPRGKRVPKTEIMSIFGVCEAAAANVMIDAGKLTKIPVDEIPESALWGKDWEGKPIKAVFAVVVPVERLQEFETLCKEMRR